MSYVSTLTSQKREYTFTIKNIKYSYGFIMSCTSRRKLNYIYHFIFVVKVLNNLNVCPKHLY